MEGIERKVEKYNQIKTDLLKMSKCLENCDKQQEELYQNICIEYSKELHEMKKMIESVYNIKVCQCCMPEQ